MLCIICEKCPLNAGEKYPPFFGGAFICKNQACAYTKTADARKVHQPFDTSMLKL